MTLPKGYGSGGRRTSSAGASQASQEGGGSGISGNILGAFIVLCIIVVVIVVIVPSLKGTIENIDKMLTQAEQQRLEAEKLKLQDGIYWKVLPISIGITAVGFFLCGWNYKEIKSPQPYELQHEQKQHTYDNIFGFLASLAITTALLTYYENFLTLIGSDLYSSTLPLNLPPSPKFYIPSLHLIDFFVIAIPLTHAGYLFLSSLANEKKVTNPHNDKERKKNLQFRLVGVFIISIILIAVLFFLAGSLAISNQIMEDMTNRDGSVTTVVKSYPSLGRFQSNGFIFWLNLLFIGMIAWSLVIRRLIRESTVGQQQVERIRAEWIWLDVFTLGFIISTSLTIFYLELVNSEVGLLYINLALCAVLVSRAVLNYHIGYNVYFPKPYQAKKESNTPV
jgi:hypothetical protein